MPAPALADALAPSGAASVLAELARGRTHYVLYALDAAALARARILAEPGGPERLARSAEAVDDCEDDAGSGWPTLECLVAAVPDADLAAPALCDSARSIGVARVAEVDAAFTLEARRTLFAATCVRGAQPGELRAADLDGDGTDEVTVLFDVAPPDGDDLSSEEGRLGYVLDGRDLHTQFRASREWNAVTGDVGGSTTAGESTWRALPPDATGHRALHVRARGTDATQDDETGESDGTPFDAAIDCPYDATADAWTCPAGAVRDYYFGAARDRLGQAWVAETTDELVGSLAPTLGSALTRAREDDEEDEEDAPPQ